MLDQYGPILIFFAIAAIIPPALLWIAKFFRPTFNPTPEKVMPYECGMTPESDARGRYTVRFYIVAILFVVFDVETVFLYPWAVILRDLRMFGFWEMIVYIGIVLVGFFYVWKKGVLDWGKPTLGRGQI